MIRSVVEAAEYAMARLEQSIDDRIGRSNRKLLGRYLAVLTIGIPIAFVVPGFHWSIESTLGLIAGLALLGIIDFVASVRRRAATRRSRERV